MLFSKELLECIGNISSILPEFNSSMKLVSGASFLLFLWIYLLYNTQPIDQMLI